MEFNLGDLWEKDLPEIIKNHKKIILIADGTRSCSDLNIITTLYGNGYKMEIETYKGKYETRAIKMIFVQE